MRRRMKRRTSFQAPPPPAIIRLPLPRPTWDPGRILYGTRVKSATTVAHWTTQGAHTTRTFGQMSNRRGAGCAYLCREMRVESATDVCSRSALNTSYSSFFLRTVGSGMRSGIGTELWLHSLLSGFGCERRIGKSNRSGRMSYWESDTNLLRVF